MTATDGAEQFNAILAALGSHVSDDDDLSTDVASVVKKCDAFEATARIQGSKLADIAEVLIGDTGAPSLSYLPFECPILESIRLILLRR